MLCKCCEIIDDLGYHVQIIVLWQRLAKWFNLKLTGLRLRNHFSALKNMANVSTHIKRRLSLLSRSPAASRVKLEASMMIVRKYNMAALVKKSASIFEPKIGVV